MSDNDTHTRRKGVKASSELGGNAGDLRKREEGRMSDDDKHSRRKGIKASTELDGDAGDLKEGGSKTKNERHRSKHPSLFPSLLPSLPPSLLTPLWLVDEEAGHNASISSRKMTANAAG